MNWEAIGAIGEVVGAGAVVLTLVYLAMQVRQNTLQVRSDNELQAIDGYFALIIEATKDPHISQILREGLHDFQGMPRQAQMQFHSVMMGFIQGFTKVYHLNRRGFIPDDVYYGAERDLMRYLKTPGGGQWWNAAKVGAPEYLRSHIDVVMIELHKHEKQLTELVDFYRDKKTTNSMWHLIAAHVE